MSKLAGMLPSKDSTPNQPGKMLVSIIPSENNNYVLKV
jgi:hypothetical protein